MLKRPRIQASWLIVMSALWLTLGYNSLFAQAVATSIPHLQLSLAVALGLLLFALHLLLVECLWWPKLGKVLLAMVFISSALAYHFMTSYGVVINADMMVNVVETDPHEASALLSFALVKRLLFFGMIPTLILFAVQIVPQRPRSFMMHKIVRVVVGIGLIATLALTSYQPLASVLRNHRDLRYHTIPTNWVGAIQSVARTKLSTPPQFENLTQGITPSVTTDEPQVLVLVLGETARTDHFGLFGYNRQTTPELAKIAANADLVAFSQVQSCGTATAISVPCMFSWLDRDSYEPSKAQYSSNLLDFFKAAGFAVRWIDNNSGCKHVCDRVEHVEIERERYPQWCQNRDYCDDRVLLEYLRESITEVQQNTVIVLHMIGSHGPAYSRRSSADVAQFTPQCETAELQLCDDQQINNSYDNSILTTDKVIAGVIHELAQHPIAGAMLYVSDHGESLGEQGLYLHGMPYWLAPQSQTHVPMIFWSDEQFRQTYQTEVDCLQQQQQQAISHDHLFHTLTGLFTIDTPVYQAKLDLSHACERIG